MASAIGFRFMLMIVMLHAAGIVGAQMIGANLPPGEELVFVTNQNGNFDVYALDVRRDILTALTHSPADESLPAWSPDGNRLAFVSDHTGRFQIYSMDADGRHIRQLTDTFFASSQPTWSPDGQHLAFVSASIESHNLEIFVMDSDGANTRQLTHNTNYNAAPLWSRDGRYIYFQSTWGAGGTIMHSGIFKVDTISGETIASDTNFLPLWSPDGGQLVFSRESQGKREIFVKATNGDARQLTHSDRAIWANLAPSWSPDGQHITFFTFFNSYTHSYQRAHIYIMQADGGHLRQVTWTDSTNFNPVWRP